jgi:catechol 2,3-dioxygenase-like lactoylglutathione lyase family enzyme
MKFHHVGISVTDIERSINFYRDMLGMKLDVPVSPLGGLKVEQVMGIRNVQCRSCHMVKGSVRLELFEFSSPASASKDANYSVADRGISHFGVEVADIDSEYERLRAAGVRFHCAVTTFQGGVKATYGRDPDGNVFELLQFGNTPSHQPHGT